jgi:hypothetical protein
MKYAQFIIFFLVTIFSCDDSGAEFGSDDIGDLSMENGERTVVFTEKIDMETLATRDEKIMCVELVEPGKAFYITVVDYWHYDLSLRGSDSRVLDGPYRLDALMKFPSNPPEFYNFNLQFLNQDLGFLYGYEVGFGYFPFLLKTTDGGQSFQRVLFKKGKGRCPFLKHSFFMFDKQNGIAITNWASKAIFHYQITSDGGDTWEKRAFDTGRSDITVYNADRRLTSVFTVDGEITTVIASSTESLSTKGKDLVLKSEDFGETFRILK